MRIVWACAQQAFAAAALWASLVWAVHATDVPPSLGAKLRVTPSVGMIAGETPVWKRVALGTYKNVNLLREDLDSLDCGTVAVPQVASVAEIGIAVKRPGQPPCNLGDAAAEIIGRPAFALSKTKRGLDLVVVTPAGLGLEGENVAVATVYARAELLGFALCPAEVGPQLRLQYLDQPLGEALHVAMLPIPRYTGEPTTFALINGGAGLLLTGNDGNLDVAVPRTRRFVFVRPR
jgi:hypothetical protein